MGGPGVIVNCPSCGYSNDEGARFCGECGVSIAVVAVCPACGTKHAGAHRFCTTCGEALGGEDGLAARERPGDHAVGERIVGARSELEGERKQVTLMFVDVAGSMDLARTLDSERWRDILDRFFHIAGESVQRFEGTVDKFTGDGIMAIFGAPVSHEDHATRACLAALDLHESMRPFARNLADEGIRFSVRVGLNSGEVIVGDIGDEGWMSHTAVGYTVGLAARMESLAPPGSTALSTDTASLVSGEFDLGDLGRYDVKGSSTPERVFELLARTPTSDHVRRPGGYLSPFVGRDREQAVLEAALERSLEGQGQVVGIVGEPGVGKSRLTREFLERCGKSGIPVRRARALAHRRSVPLLTVLELWRATLGVGMDDEPAQARDRIEHNVIGLASSFADDLPLIFDFLGVPDPDRPAAIMDPEARQRQLLAVLRRLVRARSRLQTAVILIEDLHWLDQASAVFLAELVRAAAGTRTLLILTYRPEYRPQLLRGSHCGQLALSPLSSSALDELLGSLLGDDPSLEGLSQLIAPRAVGNPFFCEELVTALAQSGRLVGKRGAYRLARPLDAVILPPTVQATLSARIDRLEDREQEVLRVAAVIGYELSEPLLHEVCDLSDDDVAAALASLVSAELLSEGIGEVGGEYVFKHPLTQEVAYRSQLSERRRRTHHRAAVAIQHLHPDMLDELASLVAQHFEAADEPLEAAGCYARAATWLGYRDVAEAFELWRRVGALVPSLADSDEARGLAIASHARQIDLGWRLGITEEQAAEHYRVGRNRAERSGDRVGLLLITAVYAVARGTWGDLRQAGELADEVNDLSIEIGGPALRISAMCIPLYSLLVRGRLRETLDLADEGIALGADDPMLGGGFGVTSPYAFCLTVKAPTLCFMGRLEESAAALEEALRVAVEQGDVETEGWAHHFCVLLARYNGQTETALAHATRADEIAEHSGSFLSRIYSLGYLGHAHLMLGHTGEAIAAFERSVALAHEAHTGLDLEPFVLAGLGEALLEAGDSARALQSASKAVDLALERATRLVLPTCYRVFAEAVLTVVSAGSTSVAERALDDATATIEETGARAELPLIERTRRRLAPVGQGARVKTTGPG
jgi:adenylate cyclase